MRKTQVNALLSDYDGTLCPTASVIGDGSVGGWHYTTGIRTTIILHI